MKTSNYLIALAALTSLTLVGCSDNDFLGTSTGPEVAQQGNGEITFGAKGTKVTRGETLEGAAAAEKLGNQFMVFGYKSGAAHAESESSFVTGTTGTGDPDDIASNPNLSVVFPFYRVNYIDGTAYTTETNTHSWEYVGAGADYVTNPVGVNGGEAGEPVNQSIKYWDWTANHYDYLSWAIKDPNAATMTALRTDNTSNNLTFLVSSPNDLANIYVANRVTIENGNKSENRQESQKYTASDANKYGNYVLFQFRNLACKVRLGIFETIPGYSVSDVHFYVDASNHIADANEAGADEHTAVLYANANTIAKSATVGVKYKQYFSADDADATADQKLNSNVAYATTSPNESGTFITFNEFAGAEKAEYKESGSNYIGRSSNKPTYALGDDEAGNNYVFAFPTSAGNLNLKVDYTLTAIDGSKETIRVTGANAVVPAGFTTWLSNYAYTYLFKISDNTNGSTGTPGTDPAGLYPITFDALVVDMDDNVQETITSVSRENSITTYQKGKVVTENDEYKAGSEPISIVCENGVALTNGTNFNLYIVNNHGAEALTEESVANYINNPVVLTKLVPGTFTRNAETSAVTRTGDFVIRDAYAGADGNEINVGASMVADFVPKAGYTYVAEYGSAASKSYKIIKIADDATIIYSYAISAAPTVFVGDATGAAFTLTGSTTDYGTDRLVLGAAKAFPNIKGVTIVSAAGSNSYTVKATSAALTKNDTQETFDLDITGATVSNKTLTVNGYALTNASIAPGTTGTVTISAGGTATIPDAVTNFTKETANVEATAITANNVTVTVAAKTPAGSYKVGYENAEATITVVPYEIVATKSIINQPTGPTTTITLSNAVAGASSNKAITVTGGSGIASAASYTTNTNETATSHTATFTAGANSGVVTLSHDAASCTVEVTHFRIKAATAIKHDKSGLDLGTSNANVVENGATGLTATKLYVCFTSDAEYSDSDTTGRKSVQLGTTGDGASIKSVGSTGLYELTLATTGTTTVTYTYKGETFTLWSGSK